MATHSSYYHTRTNPLLRSLHWLTAILLTMVWVFVYAKGGFEKGSAERSLLQQMHAFVGLSILMLFPLRMLVRWFSPLPVIRPTPPTWQTVIAKIMHGLLYLGMFALPILAILFTQANDRTVTFLTWELPTLISVNKPLAAELKAIHKTLGLALLYLAIAHIIAALWHHFIQRDNTLKRML